LESQERPPKKERGFPKEQERATEVQQSTEKSPQNLEGLEFTFASPKKTTKGKKIFGPIKGVNLEGWWAG